ncbi:putative reverse transcriptase domain-containing protein [Tanacetum coccineum]
MYLHSDFLKYQPLNFKGTEGVVGLSQWFERMESVFHISNCTVDNQVKFATCTLHSVALTWWNTHVKTVGHDAAYSMPWKTLMKMMTHKYCPQNEIKKLEMMIWDLKVKESDKIEKYVGGLPDMIHGSVVESKPKTMQDAVEIATELMDKKIHTFAERETESKRKFEDTSRNTQNQQQQQNKRQNTGRAYTCQGLVKRNNMGDLNPYALNAIITTMVHVLLNVTSATELAIWPVTFAGHLIGNVQKLKNNNNHGNQVRGGNAPAKVYTVGHVGTNPYSNVMTGAFLLNNRYAFILFDTGADRSFVSTTFSPQIDITPTALDHYYDVELADERIIGTNQSLCVPRRSFVSLGNETLIVHGDRSNRGTEARLHIISYTKTQEYMLKGCPVFLANVTTKEMEDKLEKKRLEDVLIVRDFPDVFPEDLSGLLPTRQVEFQIDLIPGS